MDRRHLLAALGALAAPLPALAQGGALKSPLTVVVPLAAGDGGDTTLRSMTEELGRELGVPVLVSNRPGAGGALGVQQVIAARKDGSTILFTQNSPLTIRRVLEPAAASYDPLRELVPLGISTRTPSILVVRKDAPFATFQDLVAQAKKAPGSVRIGNAGPGSAGDLSVQLINSLVGVEMSSIPYKGAAPAVTDVLGGQVEAVILALGAVATHLRSGALKALALSGRHPDWPDVPTLGKLGYKGEILGVWFGWMAPAGTPPELLQALLPALEKASNNAETVRKLQGQGLVQAWEPAARLREAITGEYDTVAELQKRLKK